MHCNASDNSSFEGVEKREYFKWHDVMLCTATLCVWFSGVSQTFKTDIVQKWWWSRPWPARETELGWKWYSDLSELMNWWVMIKKVIRWLCSDMSLTFLAITSHFCCERTFLATPQWRWQNTSLSRWKKNNNNTQTRYSHLTSKVFKNEGASEYQSSSSSGY